MKPVTREFRDEVLAVLMCWWMMETQAGVEVTTPWAGAASANGITGTYRKAAFLAPIVNDAGNSIRGIERAIATVERWPVLP